MDDLRAERRSGSTGTGIAGCRSEAEVVVIIGDHLSYPAAKENVMDHEYIGVGPLLPLRLLMVKP